MNNEHTLYLCELLELNFFLGITTFLIGSILFSLFLFKRKMLNRKYPVYIFSQFVVSYVLSLIIWFIWSIDVGVMFHFLLMPAFIAEIIASIVIYLFAKCKHP